MNITEENITALGFSRCCGVDDFGIDEWRAMVSGCTVAYFMKVCFADLGLHNVYVYYPDGSVKEFEGVTDYNVLKEIVNNI